MDNSLLNVYIVALFISFGNKSLPKTRIEIQTPLEWTSFIHYLEILLYFNIFLLLSSQLRSAKVCPKSIQPERCSLKQSEGGINSDWCIYGGNYSHLLRKELLTPTKRTLPLIALR
jgi:hypothetical protein